MSRTCIQPARNAFHYGISYGRIVGLEIRLTLDVLAFPYSNTCVSSRMTKRDPAAVRPNVVRKLSSDRTSLSEGSKIALRCN